MTKVSDVYGDRVSAAYDQVVRIVGADFSAPLKPILDYQLKGMRQSKGFRPALVFAAAEASGCNFASSELVNRAACVHLLHEVTLMLDDVFDRSRTRRGRLATHCKFGRNYTISAALWAKELITRAYVEDRRVARALNECSLALLDGEARQWRMRTGSRPIAIDQWERVAQGDTTALFVLAASLGQLDSHTYVDVIGRTYHGIDDLHDLLDIEQLGGGGSEDIRDRVPTLLACFCSGFTYQDLFSAVPCAISYLQHELTRRRPPSNHPLEPFFLDLDNWLTAAVSKFADMQPGRVR
ncbi:hypothetical protein ELG69_16305 [Rhizobium leguminosarum]|uniref:polyprenyl synthetase family protein n=1 Tax=Rhizobium leguminosarum TaxID=384 RepID=UPI00102FD2B8|nr:polyprenyl synthetase family protein [Rhizobium leguminosarum]TBG85552.1 hypothetical protein ELG69_16305 [Rhizobium leguminosarum]